MTDQQDAPKTPKSEGLVPTSAGVDDSEYYEVLEADHVGAEIEDVDPMAALLGGSTGALELGSLLDSAMAMQQQLQEAQEALAEQEVEGIAGGGVVKVKVTGGMAFQAVTIDPSAVDPDDVEMLQDLVLAALHDAVARVEALQQSSMGGLGGGGLSGLLGG